MIILLLLSNNSDIVIFSFLLIFQLYFCLIYIEINNTMSLCSTLYKIGSACNAFALASAANEGPQYLVINGVIIIASYTSHVSL